MITGPRYSFFRRIARPLAIVLVVLAIMTFWKNTSWMPDVRHWFAAKPVLIDKTPLVINEIRSISELYTARYYAEIVADSAIVLSAGGANATLRAIGLPTLPVTETRKLVLIVKGKVVAGINMQQLDSSAVFMQRDSIAVKLPRPGILEVVTNPSDFETFVEEGTWTEAERTAVKNKARRKLVQQAMQQNLPQKAGEQAVEVIEHFLRAAGFTKINITIA